MHDRSHPDRTALDELEQNAAPTAQTLGEEERGHTQWKDLKSYPTGPGLSLSPGGMSLPSPNFRPIPIFRLSPLGSTPRAPCLPSTLAPAKIAATLACSARVHRARART